GGVAVSRQWRETRDARGYTEVPVRLPFRRPLEPRQLFGHLVATAVPGVEEWNGTSYRRTLRLPHGHGILSAVPPCPTDRHIAATLLLTDVRDLAAAGWRARRLQDLDADAPAVDGALGEDPRLAPMVTASAGRRVPRTADPAGLAIRIVLGQQISTAGARRLTGDLGSGRGDPI